MTTASVQKQLETPWIASPLKWPVTIWVFLLAFITIYSPIILGLAKEWWTNDDYSHGLLVPFAIGYLIWEKRSTFRDLPLRPSNWGLAIVVFSQLALTVGYLGAEFFVQRTSLLIFVSGAIVFLAGWRYFSNLAFSLVLLLLAIPLPAIVFNAIAFPLQLIASSWAESFLRMCQIPVYRDGNVLQLSHQLLNVTEACSGIRSLMSLLSLATMLAYFLPLRWWARLVFILTAVPIAIIANSFRVAGTGLLTQFFGEKAAQGFFHSFSGWLVFLFAFVVLLAELLLLQRWAPKASKAVEKES
jgi:exosortase